MSPVSVEQVLTLPLLSDTTVPESFIDENGHMNIRDYFSIAAYGPWQRMVEFGMDPDYISERGLSFFTVEHRVSYLGEMRLGDRYSLHAGFAGRTDKALHAAAYIVDRGRERLACTLEVVYLHVSMTTRRSTPIPADLAAALDTEIADHPWVACVADGLSLRR